MAHVTDAESVTLPVKGHAVPALAKAWGVSRQQVYALIAEGQIKAFHVGQRIVVPDSEVRRVEAGGLNPEAVAL